MSELQTAAAAVAGPSDETYAFPVTFQQQRLWFLDQFEPGTSLYNVPAAVRVHGAIDTGALQAAVAALVERHEILRTVFRAVNEQPVQVVGACRPVPLDVVDLRHLPEDAREAEAGRLRREEARRPFSLEHGPLLRFVLLRLADTESMLLMTLHHIISDAWSLGVLSAELGALYGAFCRGEPSPLPELPLQYADVAVWQRDTLKDEALAAEVDWWKERLAGAPAALELPTDRPRPPHQSYEGAFHGARYSQELMDSLRALARREECTLYMVLAAAFSILLARYSGQDDVVVGTPIANRTDDEVEALIGLFANTLAMRTRLEGNPTFRQLLARVREETLEAYAHQDVPFEKLVEELGVERDMSRTPIFQVMFILQNTRSGSATLGDLPVTGINDEGAGTAKFDLAVAMTDLVNGGMVASMEYATALFDAATIERMGAHFGTLLAGIAATPDARVHDLPLMDRDERERVLFGWNATGRAWPAGLVHQMVSARAAERPDAVAVVAPDGEMTYGELEERSNRLAWRLRSMGVAPGVLVGLCVERSAEMMVGLLGVLKAGGAYVPIDPDYPADRIAYMLRDSGARVLLAQSRLADQLPATGAAVLRIDADWPAIAAEPGDAPEPVATADDVAYVIYTSGSTGRPKGVQVRHGGVANFLHSMREKPGLAADDVLVAVTTLSFDIAVLELFLPLATGARVVIASREQASDAVLLRGVLDAAAATVMQATPATWRMLIASGWTPPAGMRVLCGGEALPRELADALLAGGAEVWNLYGPTETTIWSTCARVERGGPVTVGGPIANTRVYVVDRFGTPVPTGVPGELLIAGDGVARGYLNRPELTAERFVPDPFAGGDARMYRTGDRVRWRADGTLEFFARLDTQVKLRGFRIELGEIESVLREHQSVAEAVAIVREDVAGDARLVAYVVPAGPVDVGGIRGLLRARLPEYMIPSAFVTLDRLPLTPNGKIDRKALPAPDAAALSGDRYVAPSTPTEEAIAGIWAELLRLPRVGVADSFFDLGGHSLLATQVMTRIRTTLGASLPVRVLFEARTVAELARRVDEAKQAGPKSPRMMAASRAAFRIKLDSVLLSLCVSEGVRQASSFLSADGMSVLLAV